MIDRLQIFAALGLLIVGVYFAVASPPNQQYGEGTLATPDIEGSEAVGINFTDAKSAAQILAQFTVSEVPCDPNASSSDCMTTQVLYKGRSVRVYAVLPLSITDEFAQAVGNFPFAGQLHYKDIDSANIDTRIVKLMQEQGNKSFDIIYEK